MKILAPLLYASVQGSSEWQLLYENSWSFMGIRVIIERKDAFKECLMFSRILSVYRIKKSMEWEKEPGGVGERTGLRDPSAGVERMLGGRGGYVPRPPSISSTPVEGSLFCAWHSTPTISQRRCKGNKVFCELQVFPQFCNH